MVLVEFIVPNLFIAQTTKMFDNVSIPECLQELWELGQQCFLADFHQSLEKERKNAWHDKYIKRNILSVGDQLLLYDSKYLKHPGKLKMHWLGRFFVAEIREY